MSECTPAKAGADRLADAFTRMIAPPDGRPTLILVKKTKGKS
jgi:hypothetical protein